MSFQTFSTCGGGITLSKNAKKNDIGGDTRGGGLINNFASSPFFGYAAGVESQATNFQSFYVMTFGNTIYDSNSRSKIQNVSGTYAYLANGLYTIRSSGYKGNITDVINNWTNSSCTFETDTSGDILYDSSLSYLTQNSYTNARSTFPYPVNSSITTQTNYKQATTTQPYDDSGGKCPPLYIFNYIDYSNNIKTAKGNWIIQTTPNRMYIKNVCIMGGIGANYDIPGKIVLIGRNNDADPWYLIKEVTIPASSVVFEFSDNLVTRRKSVVVPVDTTPDTSNKYGYKQTCAIFTELIKGGILSFVIFDYDARLYA